MNPDHDAAAPWLAYADPTPWLRCRCVSWMTRDGWRDDWNQRCSQRPTGEDGLCDHCRQTGGCADPQCTDRDGTRGYGCCLQPGYAARTLVHLTTPCRG